MFSSSYNVGCTANRKPVGFDMGRLDDDGLLKPILVDDR